MNYLFSKQIRLSGKAQFQEVFDQPFRSADSFFVVLARRNQIAIPRLGLAISRKVSKRAVVRNRLKRICRENFRLHQERLAGLDIVIMGRNSAVGADNAQLHHSLLRHWKRISEI